MKRALLILAVAAVSLLVPRPASALKFGCEVVPVPDTEPAPKARGAGSGYGLVYLNRSGGTYIATWNTNNAVTNRSSIPNSNATIPPFEGTDAQWNELVACVKYQYARYDITITTTDPSPTPHIEASIGGTPDLVGRDSNTGGVAPGSCNPQDNTVVFNFSQIYNGDMTQLCFTVAHEVGHALGLEHEFKCEDPMTYLSGCGFKTFQNSTEQCGTYSATSCSCRNGQNTHQHLASWLGLRSDASNPTVRFTSPGNNGTPEIGFTATISASDDVAIERVELHVDNVKVGEGRFAPYAFPTPQNIGLGNHRLDAHAWDVMGKHTVDTINVVVTADGQPPECFEDTDCGTMHICHNLKCYDNSVLDLGEVGDDCTENTDCYSGLCGNDGANQYCTEDCTGGGTCPEGTACRDTGGGFSVCWPDGSGGGGSGNGDESGGCSTGGGAGAGGILALLALLAVVRRRRA